MIWYGKVKLWAPFVIDSVVEGKEALIMIIDLILASINFLLKLLALRFTIA